MDATIYVPDIECDSCVKLITKRLESQKGVTDFEVDEGAVIVEYDDAAVKADAIVGLIRKDGFRASLAPFDRKSLGERWRDFRENKSKYAIERDGIVYALSAFVFLLLVEAIAYVGFFDTIPGFLSHYGWWLLYLDITVVSVGLGLWHISAYRARMTCMVGMMLGMTVGMQAGMMLGAVVGATNGFFIGSMAGMLVGVFTGVVAGKGCGVMGTMQGMMAGLMGGTMGPMISVMMFSDHLLWFMPFYMAINVAIMAGMSYMVYEEMVEGKEVFRQPLDFLTFVSACIIIAAVFVIIMVYGPKAPLFAV